jgi:hypothetical protein
MYFHTKIPAPILNTFDFSSIFDITTGEVRCDEKGHIRALEFIALKDMVFEIKEHVEGNIYRVSIPIYSKDSLFLDKRFGELCTGSSIRLEEKSFDRDELLQKLLSFLGISYLWGGNWSRGIPEMLLFYPPQNIFSNEKKDKWQLKGIDCSGMLFEATGGLVPRNTFELMSFGRCVATEKTSINEIILKVEPLDMVVYKGHVMIVVDRDKLIESREGHGVIISSLEKRLLEIFCPFYVRRWLYTQTT